MGVKISTLRDSILSAEENGGLSIIHKEMDPRYEIASVTKAFDGGPLLIFEKVRGYPNWKILSNLMANRDMVAKYFGVTKDTLSQQIIRSISNPIDQVFSENAPCHENVIDKNIDVLETLPVMTHTPMDLGPVITGGIAMVKYPAEMAEENLAFNLSYHRLNPSRGPDWLTLAVTYGHHFFDVLRYHRQREEEYPLTINIGLSPALNIFAAGGTLPQLRSKGLDDLRAAGALQGEAVKVCKAKTVDAYCIAEAEIVLEGKILYNERVYEYDKATQEPERPPYFFPEATGHEGVADRAFKFQVTAITYRNSPYYVSQMGDSKECSSLSAAISEACIYNACKNHAPDNFINCHMLDCMRGVFGAVIQCKINHIRETGISQGLISAAFGAFRELKFVIVVDEDVNIYDPEDVFWAVTIRTKPDRDINIIKKAGLGDFFETRWSIDTTVPFNSKWRAVRPKYEKVDITGILDQANIERGFSLMGNSAKKYAKRQR